MGDEETALVRAVLADPGDDAPRLIYRDWLDERGRWAYETVLALVLAYPEADGPRLLAARWWEENGESERAEFVRVQCAIEPLRNNGGGHKDRYENDKKWAALRRREGELHWSWNLWAPGGPRWHDAPGWGFEWRRGFIRAATCMASQWLKHGDVLTGEHPVEEVTLTTVPPQPDRAETLLHEAWPRVKHWHLPRIIEPSRTHGAPWQAYGVALDRVAHGIPLPRDARGRFAPREGTWQRIVHDTMADLER